MTSDGENSPAVEPLVASDPAAPRRLAVGTCAVGANWGVRRDDLAYLVVRVTNAHRRRLGLSRLRVLPALTRSATWKAQHMARYFYFGHVDPAPPVTRSVPQRLAACGFSQGGSENLAYGFETPSSVVAAWLRSPGHRRNLEQPRWQFVGVGAATSEYGGTFWAQNFG